MNSRLKVAMYLLLFGACEGERPPERAPVPVRVQQLEATVVDQALRFAADVRPVMHMPVLFTEAGRIVELAHHSRGGQRLLLDAGDPVTQGQVLAVTEAVSFEEAVDETRAAHVAAKAAFSAATSTLRAVEALVQTKSATEMELQRALEAEAEAAARIAQTRAAHARAKRALGRTNLRSPITGVVVERAVELGLPVGPGVVAFVVADTSRLLVQFGVPDSFVGALSIGQQLTFHPNGRSPGHQGEVVRIAPVANPEGRMFTVQLLLKEPGGLRAGAVGHVMVRAAGEAPERPKLVVPLSSIVGAADDQQSFFLFTVDSRKQPAVAERRAVTLGDIVRDSVVVTSGLSAGQSVVVRGHTRLRDGVTVRLMP